MFRPHHLAPAPARLRRIPIAGSILTVVAAIIAFAVVPVTADAAVARTVEYGTPGQYEFTVPAGVTSVSVTAVGAAGGANCEASGGKGAKLGATVPVTPGEPLAVTVGEAGVDRVCSTGEGPSVATLGGGARGGASGSYLAGSAGGGATSLRLPSFAPEPAGPALLVAGGGGGAAESEFAGGGNGGNAGAAGLASGEEHPGQGGQPGGASTGGTGGAGASNCNGEEMGESGGTGVSGVGGHGGDFTDVGAGGGGGGGYYGGGGGGGGCRGGGGGGGSSFVMAAGTVTEAPAPSAEGARLSITYLMPMATATIVTTPGPFPSTAQGEVSAPQTVEITDTGEAPLTIGGASFAGADPGDFLVGSSTCGAPIEPGGSCQFQVRFNPQGQGGRTATLLVASNDPGSPAEVPLSGTGGAPPIGLAGPRGETGAAGPRGPAGKTAVISCEHRRSKKGSIRKCKTMSGQRSIDFSPGGSKIAAVLRRGGIVYAKGFQATAPDGETRLVMEPSHRLRRGDYVLTLGSADGLRREEILIS